MTQDYLVRAVPERNAQTTARPVKHRRDPGRMLILSDKRQLEACNRVALTGSRASKQENRASESSQDVGEPETTEAHRNLLADTTRRTSPTHRWIQIPQQRFRVRLWPKQASRLQVFGSVHDLSDCSQPGEEQRAPELNSGPFLITRATTGSGNWTWASTESAPRQSKVSQWPRRSHEPGVILRIS